MRINTHSSHFTIESRGKLLKEKTYYVERVMLHCKGINHLIVKKHKCFYDYEHSKTNRL